MKRSKEVLRGILMGWCGQAPTILKRRPHSRRIEFSWDCLEGRAVPAHFGGGFHAAFAHGGGFGGFGGFGGPGGPGGGPGQGAGGSGSTTSAALAADVQQLQTDIRTIQGQSSETLAEAVAARSDTQALAKAGYNANRQDLQTFENDLLTDVAASQTAGNGGALTSDQTTTLQGELGTAFGTTVASTAGLGTLYNDLLAIAQASNITTANLTTIASDQAQILSDLGTTTTTTTTTTGGMAGCGIGGGGAAGLANATAASLLIPGF